MFVKVFEEDNHSGEKGTNKQKQTKTKKPHKTKTQTSKQITKETNKSQE